MKARSLQARMALGYIGILVFVLVGYGAVFYRVSNHLLMRQADQIGLPVMVEQYKASVERARTRLLLLYSFSTPLVVLLASIGGFLVARIGLRPLMRVTRTARVIDSQHLDQTIALTGAGDELDGLIETLNQMLARLHASFERIQEFTANASHELRTPLTAMRGEIEVALSQDRNPEEYRSNLRSLLGSTQGMTQIVEELLVLTQADSGQIRMRMESIHLPALIDDAQQNVTPVAALRDQRIVIDGIPEVAVRGDRLWLERLLINVLDNALKYSPEGAVVRVSCVVDHPQRLAEVAVTDEGIGIPQEELPRIFDRFYRVDKSRSRAPGGAGLGLSIVQWIAHHHGTEIAIKSEPGKGTRMSVAFNIEESPE